MGIPEVGTFPALIHGFEIPREWGFFPNIFHEGFFPNIPFPAQLEASHPVPFSLGSDPDSHPDPGRELLGIVSSFHLFPPQSHNFQGIPTLQQNPRDKLSPISASREFLWEFQSWNPNPGIPDAPNPALISLRKTGRARNSRAEQNSQIPPPGDLWESALPRPVIWEWIFLGIPLSLVTGKLRVPEKSELRIRSQLGAEHSSFFFFFSPLHQNIPNFQHFH